MSIPNDPQQPDQPEAPQFDASQFDAPEAPAVPVVPAAPIDAPQSFDAPTAAYPAGGFAAEQPTVPQAPYGQPAYPAAPQPGYPQAPQDAYGQPVYGQPVAPVMPFGPRPKTLAIIALVLAVVGLIMAFIPVVNMFAGVLLLPAFIIAIIALVKKTQGGKGFSIAALIISVIGWIVSIVMIIAFFVAAAAVNFNDNIDFGSSSTPLDPEESATTDGSGTDVEPGVYSEAAFIDASKPTVVRILSDAIPNATPELVAQMFPDEVLLALGQAIVMQDQLAGGLMNDDQEQEFRDAFVGSMSESGGISTEAAAEFYDVVAAAARAHLVK